MALTLSCPLCEQKGWAWDRGLGECTGRGISILFGINGLRNELSQDLGPAFKACFSAIQGHFLRALIEIESLLIVASCTCLGKQFQAATGN